ncbi:MAG: hypothetical protein ABSG01_01085 [Anaerolineales bacterium]
MIQLIAFPLWGILRDFGRLTIADQTGTMIGWGNSLVPGLTDFLLWGCTGAAKYFTMCAMLKWPGTQLLKEAEITPLKPSS